MEGNSSFEKKNPPLVKQRSEGREEGRKGTRTYGHVRAMKMPPFK